MLPEDFRSKIVSNPVDEPDSPDGAAGEHRVGWINVFKNSELVLLSTE